MISRRTDQRLKTERGHPQCGGEVETDIDMTFTLTKLPPTAPG